ncbi:ABC transporter permease [Micromonospora sp. WMMA1923]|uniref:ABC transporter permease n=1 Tax=Micromonospora sp. WMMA1923 TaxID=3404125 RepID=UPI003B95B6F8
MKISDLVGSAAGNAFRAKTRTLLTILAIFIGAFTLTLTNGLGTGINDYIDDTVTAIGASDVMTVVKPSEGSEGFGNSSGPVEYDPDTVASAQPGPPGQTVVALTPADLDSLAAIDGVRDVQASKAVRPDYIQAGTGPKYVVTVGGIVAGQQIQLAAGAEPDDSSTEPQVVLPTSYVEPLGFADAGAALGQTVSIAITDAERTAQVVEATIVGVAEESFASPEGASVLPNATLTDTLFDAQNTGLSAAEAQRYAQASVWFDPDATEQEVDALKGHLADAGYNGVTVDDQLGTFKSIIDGIVLVLNAFAVIALLAASFGIVNTLFMSVQERTREIGLMKAMGMGSGRVFGLFSLEATFIGFVGSAVGAALAMLAGTVISSMLADSFLADLPGLTLIAFDPLSIAAIILLVMTIAFLAGTLPAARAARADPVDSLRYE